MKLINLSSKNRVSGNDGDFTINIPNMNYQSTHACLLDIQLPTSFYVVNNNNNKIGIVESDSTTSNGYYRLHTLTNGNYTISEYIAHVKSVLDSGTDLAIVYTLSTSSISGKITLFTSTPNRKFYLVNTSNWDNISGFTSDNSIPENYLSVGTIFVLTASELLIRESSITGQNNYNISGPLYCSLSSSINISGSFDSNNSTLTNIIAKIPLLQNSNAIVYYQPTSTFWFEIYQIDGQLQTFTIRDSNNNIIDTNGIPIEFSILIK